MNEIRLNGIGPVELVRSRRRRTVSAEIRQDGQVIVHAPYYFPKYLIVDFLRRREDWIRINRTKVLQKNALLQEQGDQHYEALVKGAGSGKKALEQLRRRTRALLEEKVPFFADRIGVTCGKVSVRAMKTRWGSCSIRGDLSFNLLLCELPEEVMDYVVIHELCHRIEMNHSARFWQLVRKQDASYSAHRKYLREQGGSLIVLLERLKTG